MTTKFIGTSFSRCLFSLAYKEISIDAVAFILTSTAYPSREVMLEQIRQTMMGRDVETHLSNAAELWDSGRIYQASTRQPAHVMENQPCWIEAPASFVEATSEDDTPTQKGGEETEFE